MNKKRYYEDSILINASCGEIFDYVDDHSRFSSHMSKSSWMMGGGSMTTELDEGNGREIGSHIRMKGKFLGIELFLDEVVTEHKSPYKKVWQTVGNPRLLVIGHYKMGIEISPEGSKSMFKVFIEYELPGNRLLGYLLGGMYAKWCVKQMIQGVREHFNNSALN